MFGFRKKQPEKMDYDRETLQPVLRCSICTGEQVAGFRDIRSGEFHEIQLIRNERDLDEFRRVYGIRDDIPKLY